MISLYAGLTSQTLDLFIQDSTTGAGETGLVFNTSGLAIYYRKGATGSFTAITLATQTVGGAWSSGGFVELDSTNAPGLYRLDIPDAAVDTAGLVTLFVKGTGIISAPTRIDCRPLPVDVKQFGGTNGTFSSGRPEIIIQDSGITAAKIAADAITDAKVASDVTIASVTGSVGSVTGNVGGSVASVTAGVTLAATTHTGAVIPTVTTLTNLPSIPTNWLTAAGIEAGALNGKGDWGTASDLSELINTVGEAGAGLTEVATQVAAALASAHGAGSWLTATGFSTLTAADVRTAIGMATNNLDTQLGLLATSSALAELVTTVGVAGAGLTEAGGTGDQFTALPRVGATLRYTQVAANSGSKTADVSIGAAT